MAVPLAAALVLAACATPGGSPEPEQAAPGGRPTDEQLSAAVEPASEAGPEALPEVVTPVASEGQEEAFQVSSEVYSRTFEEIEAFIRQMNRIIQGRDFAVWKTFLSVEYMTTVSSARYLAEQSEQPLLKKHNLQLESLEDYFEHVVVPSRSGAQLDDIEFIDEDHVKAISIIRNTRGLLYLLVREDGRWKIGIW